MRAEIHRMLDGIDLVMFDLDGTLIASHLSTAPGGVVPMQVRPYAEVSVLPGRLEGLEVLRRRGLEVAVCTNQGGMAFRYQSSEETNDKLRDSLMALGFPRRPWGGFAACVNATPANPNRAPAVVYAALGHPKAIVESLRTGPDDQWRKPGPGMLLQAMADHGVPPERALFVGDMESDSLAAGRAHVTYVHADHFFGAGETEAGA